MLPPLGILALIGIVVILLLCMNIHSKATAPDPIEEENNKEEIKEDEEIDSDTDQDDKVP